MPDPAVQRLQRALERFPVGRFPVKHASIQRELAVFYAAAGATEGAERALRTALAAYGDELPVERAVTLNALGSVLRDEGRLGEAATTLEEAASLLGSGSPDGAGVLFNLGLVKRDLGEVEQAEAYFRAAVEGFAALSNPAELGAALRELGGLVLTRGDVREAIAALERASDLAARGGDRAGLAGSLNGLGLAYLAVGEGEKAVISLAEAVAAHPVTVRPDMHAMAKANLALAYERCGHGDRARMLANQVLSISEAPDSVRSQADQILDRLGTDYDLHGILDVESQADWEGILRDEIRHWIRSDSPARQSATEAWVAGQLQRLGGAVDRCAALLSALLELPPQEFVTLTSGLVSAWERAGEPAAGVFQELAARAAAQFSPPQMARLEAALALDGRGTGTT